MTEPENASDVRLRSRIWSILRALVFICVIVFIWEGWTTMACSFVGIALIMGWVNLFQLKSQEIEKPYYRLWLNTIDGFLQFIVMASIFARDLPRGAACWSVSGWQRLPYSGQLYHRHYPFGRSDHPAGDGVHLHG